jgi:GTP-binding protein
VDKQLAGYILDQYRPTIFVVNKWDLAPRGMPTGKLGDYLRAVFPNLDFVPIAFITAKEGKNVQAVLNLAQNLHKQANVRVGTGELNRVLRQALEHQRPPLRQNRRPKIFYGTQAAADPPTLVLFTNGPELFDNTYQRYLIKAFRDHLPFNDVPIKLYLRHKHREGRPPEGEEVDAVGPEAPPPRNRQRARGRKDRESEVWKDL